MTLLGVSYDGHVIIDFSSVLYGCLELSFTSFLFPMTAEESNRIQSLWLASSKVHLADPHSWMAVPRHNHHYHAG
jgi:hypothetical protein